MGARVVGTGSYLPPFVVTNAELCRLFQADERFNEQWIDERLGILERRFAYDFGAGRMREGFHDLDLGERAARAALAAGGIGPHEIDAILYATSTPEYHLPDSACSLHLRLGGREDAAAAALTSVGCAGTVYLIVLADALIRSETATTVLLVCSNSASAYFDRGSLRRDRVSAAIFGDGAGAMVLRAGDGAGRIVATYWGADGVRNPLTFVGGGSRHPATVETVTAGLHHFKLDVRAVKERGPALFARAVGGVLAKAKVGLDDVDAFVFHQVNYRLLVKLAEDLGIPRERLVVHVDRYGNTGSAAVAIGLDTALGQARIRPGALVLCAAVGAGWQYGAVLLEW